MEARPAKALSRTISKLVEEEQNSMVQHPVMQLKSSFKLTNGEGDMRNQAYAVKAKEVAVEEWTNKEAQAQQDREEVAVEAAGGSHGNVCPMSCFLDGGYGDDKWAQSGTGQ